MRPSDGPPLQSVPLTDDGQDVIAGGNRSIYPPGNLFPSLDEFRSQFTDFAGHDFRLKTGSAWLTAATDGRSLGAETTRVPRPPREIDRPPRR